MLYTTNGASINLNLNGGAITGASEVVALATYRSGAAGAVVMANVGDIVMGKLDTRNTSSSGAGSITIGSLAVPAVGTVRIADIDAYTHWSSGGGAGGNVAIFGTSDVLIQTAAGAMGSIDTHCLRAGYPDHARAGTVTIRHHGAFVAQDIIANGASGGNWTGGNDVTLQGDYGSGPAGACTVRQILTYTPGATYGGIAGNITITGYSSVMASNLWAYNNLTTPGNVTITNIAGDILVSGTIDTFRNGSPMGTVTLQTAAGSGGDITVTNLDLTRMSYISFAPDGAGYINGLLTGTNGAAASGLGNIGTALRARAGRQIRYWKKANPALAGQAYNLADESGTPGAGGRLRPWPSNGTVVYFR